MPSIYVNNLGRLPKRRDHDFYPTQRALIRVGVPFSLDLVYSGKPRRNQTFRILDMGAGDGRWGQITKAYFLPRYTDVVLDGVEIRNVPKPDGFDHWYVTDGLTWEPPAEPYDLVVGNTPFDIATELIYLAHRVSRGNVLYLLPRDFGGSDKRYSGLQVDHPVSYENVSARRPSFSGDNGTGGTVYSLWHWIAGRGEPHAWQTRVFNWELDSADVDPVALALRRIRQKATRDAKRKGVDELALLLSYYRNPPVALESSTPESELRFKEELSLLIKDLEHV